MFIATERTPNPLTLKFIPGIVLIENGSVSFLSQEEALGKSEFAFELFNINHVTGVYIGTDFVSIIKDADIEWEDLKPEITGFMIEFFNSGKPVVGKEVEYISNNKSSREYDEHNQSIVDQIIELIDTRVRPAVAQDGGDIVFEDFVDGVVYLRLLGACEGCPSSSVTLKMGIENMLKYYIPEILEVEAIDASMGE